MGRHVLLRLSQTRRILDDAHAALSVGAARSVTSLTIGEPWSLPAMFRVALIESVRRMTLRTMRRMQEITARG